MGGFGQHDGGPQQLLCEGQVMGCGRWAGMVSEKSQPFPKHWWMSSLLVCGVGEKVELSRSPGIMMLYWVWPQIRVWGVTCESSHIIALDELMWKDVQGRVKGKAVLYSTKSNSLLLCVHKRGQNLEECTKDWKHCLFSETITIGELSLSESPIPL